MLFRSLLVVNRAAPPLTLRVDHSEAPLAALADLHRRATTGEYADWARHVPVLDDPTRALPYAADDSAPIRR